MKRFRAGWACWLALGACAASAANIQDWQDPQAIRQAAVAYVDRHAPAQSGNRVLEAAELDRRLRLSACAEDLEAFLPTGMRFGGNVTVGVRCRSPRPWKIYVPVRVRLRAEVVVADTVLARHKVLEASDLVLEERDLDRLSYGYFEDPKALIGKRTLRPVSRGVVLIPSMLGDHQLIRRGQNVTLVTERKGIKIRMSGQALADGAANQRIRVRNTSSTRVVEGVVRSSEVVEIVSD